MGVTATLPELSEWTLLADEDSLVGSKYTAYILKSVQSTLSHPQSHPGQIQSQRHYGSFLSKSLLQWHDLINNACPKLPKK